MIPFARHAGAALAAAALLAVPARARADAGQTLVVVQSDDPVVVLESRTGDDQPWRVVCTGACGRTLPLAAQYRFAGPDVRDSHPFELQPNGDRAILRVHARHEGAHTAGVVLTAIGATFLVASIVATVVFASQPPGGDGFAVFNVGGAIAVLGGVVVGLSTLVPGLVLLAHDGSSRVEQAGVAERREPVFDPAPQLASAPAFHVTVLSFAF